MKTTLLLGVHSHQPIDNFDHVVLDAIAKSYQPFFETMDAYEDFKFSAHFSGWLLEFIKAKVPSLFDLMRKMSARGQIEWFGGGFYEPILASIPSRDRKAQINKLSGFLERNFGRRPKGLWLTERVWDAAIVGDLIDCGIEYAIIDDYHLLCAGVEKSRLNGWHITEEGGRKIGLFPISQPLRYQAPFWDHQVVAENIAAIGGAAILFDDGEKFGVWPGTHEWVYEKGWLKNFAEAVLKNGAIETGHYADFKAQNLPLGVVYPPDVSYAEMGEWSLRAKDTIRLEELKNSLKEDDRVFARGASWKNFLVKYDESARIHRRALALSKQNPLNNREFEEALLKAECNDCLWHGVFGGLYLPNLRDTAWRYLIAAEKALGIKEGFSYKDWNLDGCPEARFSCANYIAGFEPKGAKLTELHYLKGNFNLLNTLTRRFEAYHGKIKKKEARSEDGEEVKTIHDATLSADENALKNLVVDRYARGGFIDHLVKGEFNLDRFFAQDFEVVEDLANTIYQTDGMPKEARFATKLVQKTIEASETGLTVTTAIGANARFVQEHNFHFANLAAVSINDESAIDPQTLINPATLRLFDPYLNLAIEISADREFSVFSHPLYTVSQSESGVDLTCQGVAIALDFGEAAAGTTIAATLTMKGAL